MRDFSKVSMAAVAAILALSVGAASQANAETQWQKDHPRRTEVNHRLAHQNARIDRKVADGQMSHAQAHQLRTDDRQIGQEEHDMARQDGGHITRSEDRTLNQQENAVSRDVHNE
jgi:hypothetical protein